MENKIVKFYMSCLIFCSFLCYCCSAVALTLDASFGKDGLVKTRVGHYVDKAQAVVVQPDGKILVAGSSSNNSNLDFALVRYNPDGSLDKTFNFNGQVVTVVGSDDDAALGVALQSDGKIVVCGYTFNGNDSDFALLRFGANGDLDFDFGVNGMVALPIGSGNDVAAAVAIQPDGAILVSGSIEEPSGKMGALVRFHANGSLDPSFGKAGMIFVDVGENAEVAAVAVQKDKSIVVAGSYEEKNQKKVLLGRFSADGFPDVDFGVEGVAITLDGTRDSVGNSLWVQEDGAILVAGSVGSEPNRDIAVFRFTSAGRLDRGFGGGVGMLSHDLNGEDDVGYGVSASAATLFVTGYATMNGLRDLILLQYPLAQAFKPELSVVTTGINQFDGVAHALALQDDTKIIVAGFSNDGGISSFVLARYAGKEGTDVKETASGTVSPFLMTAAITDITRVGCMTGGVIKAGSGLTFTKRGVVYSTDPFPVLAGATDGTSGDDNGSDNSGGGTDDGGTDGGGNDTDDTGPTRSDPVPPAGTVLPTDTSETTISLKTSEAANCRYYPGTGTAYLSMIPFETTGGTTHSTLVTGLHAGTTYTYSVKCQDQAGNINNMDYVINFSVSETKIKEVAGSGKSTNQGVQPGQGQSFSSSAKETGIAESILSPSPAKAGGDITAKATGGSTSDGDGEGSYVSVLSKLAPGTRYYVRAYGVTSKNIVYYGNQLSFETQDSCFIATAAYGSVLDPHVQILRSFRDVYLLSHEAGRVFVRLYYHYSPPVADFIADHLVLRLLVRIFLLPIIVCSYIAIHFGIISLGLALFAILGTVTLGFRIIHFRKMMC